MNQITRILIEVTAYSFVLFAAVMLFKRLFRKHISPVLGYAVWALLILRLIIPVTIDSNMKLFVIPEAPIQTAQTQSAAVPNQEVTAEIAERADSTAPVYNDSADRVSDDRPLQSADETATLSENAPTDIKPAAAKPISWQTALVMLWAAGVAVSAGLLLLLFSRIQRKTARGSNVPVEILRLMDACKRDMGIRADIKVLVLDWLDTPALTASIKPKLLLPKSMLQGMNLRQIEFGIRHELMHYRRRDYMTALLLMLLRCVYWFNPVVWLAVRQIETDMEAACDAAVTASLGRRECFDYAQTMIDLSSKANVYMLGMGVSTGRASMEKRVRGIFMDRRTKLPVRLAALVLSSLLIFTCFTTACQPVKAQPVNTSASADISEETAAAEPEATPVPEPEVNPNEGYGSFPDWVETYTIPNLNVDINAKIVTPETDVFPVYKVKKRSFDDETLQKMLDYFAGDAVGVRDYSFTADELKEQLKYFKEHDAKQKDTIEDLKTQIELAQPEVFAPIDKNATLIDGLIFQRADGSKVNYMARENWCEISNFTGNNNMQLEDWIRNGSWPHLIKFMDKTLEASKITKQEAIDLAEKSLVDMGIEDMGVIHADRAVISNTCLDAFPSAGWLVSIGRSDGGSVPADLGLQASAMFDFSEKDYFERWQDEEIKIYVDDNGVETLTWHDPMVVSGVAEENVTLLPWEDAKQAIKDAMASGWSKIVERQKEYGQEISDLTYVVDKIDLANVLVPQGDDLDYQLMVPAWVVYHKDVWEYNGQKGETNSMIFAVNAVDGTVIDLEFRSHEVDKRTEERRKQQEQEQAAEPAAE